MLDWLQETWNEAKEFAYSLLLTIVEFLKDIAIWIFEQFMDLSILAIHGLDSVFSGLDIASHINSLPPAVSFYASSLGLSQAMSMIIISLTLRFLLQLIPFTRLGS
ncbi:VSK receptor (plasmid) [Pseudoalteromonas sp. CF6-2]|uniref:VSK receptor n=1 Tax=Pseudoalteromonas sp. CF6-2 TaxID=562716 RepID=UPI001F157E59|nr:VSK receptor [Pseudoalteromonas sp. CF6-2]